MGFTINHGFPGVLMALLILFGVAVAAIVIRFLAAVVTSARDDVESAQHDSAEEDEPQG